MIHPKVTVITAVYNSEKYVGECIQSIIDQTFQDWEMILINDASTDNGLEIIKEFMKKDNRIKLINLKKNVGAAEARNKGLKIAVGKHIAIMDSDKYCTSPNKNINFTTSTMFNGNTKEKLENCFNQKN